MGLWFFGLRMKRCTTLTLAKSLPMPSPHRAITNRSKSTFKFIPTQHLKRDSNRVAVKSCVRCFFVLGPFGSKRTGFTFVMPANGGIHVLDRDRFPPTRE